MTGLAWYYLLAAMLNAAAAAYVAYMEMVSEGASRAGLAPRTRRLPDWLVVAFLGLYGLATLLILGRDVPARRRSRSPTASAPWRTSWWRSRRGPTPRTSPRSRTPGTAAGPSSAARASTTTSRPSASAGRSTGRSGRSIWAVVAVIFQAMGLVYILGGEFALPAVHPRRRSTSSRARPPSSSAPRSASPRCSTSAGSWPTAWSPGGSSTLFLLLFGLSMTDSDFRDIVTKPDNVPIVGADLPRSASSPGWACAAPCINDDAHRPRALPLEKLEDEKMLVWPDLVYTELIAWSSQTSSWSSGPSC